MLNRLFSTCLISFLMQSCGGESNTPNEMPDQATISHFSLSSLLVNECGVESPFTDVKLLVQDEQWNVINEYQADETGVISFETEKTKINYTLISPYKNGNDRAGYEVLSYTDVRTESNAKYYATFDSQVDSSSCECVTTDVTLMHRPFTQVENMSSSATFKEAIAINDEQTLFSQVEFCRKAGNDWPLQSFKVAGTVTGASDESIAVAGFLTYSDPADNVVSALHGTSSISLAKHSEFESYQLINGTKHFAQKVPADSQNMNVFNSHSYISESFFVSHAEHVFDEKSSRWGTIKITSSYEKKSTDAQEAFAVIAPSVKPNIDDVNFSEIQNDSYNYSKVNGYPFVGLEFGYEVYNKNTNEYFPLITRLYGPSSGMLPAPLALLNFDENVFQLDIKTTTTTLVNSAKAEGYDDYMEYFQNSSNSDLTHDIKRYVIAISDN